MVKQIVVPGKIIELEEIANRFISSLNSDLHAFVFDTDIIDPSIVSRLVSVAGIDQYLRRYSQKNIVIYALDSYKIERQCRMDHCRNVALERQRICLSRCIHARTKELIELISKSLRDAVDMIRG